jgi:hypothetical protein
VHTNFADESEYLMADNVWNEGKYLTCGPLDAITFHGEQSVHVWEFVYDLSAVDRSYQLQ